MTGAPPSKRGAVWLLTAQAVVFGAVAALLGIVANAMFLEAYGSGWLPATYIAIAAAGIVVSGAVARSAQRFDLLGIELAVLGGATAGIAASWAIARAGGAWVSVPLLVAFPILIQLGFVFIGGQAGRILDIGEIKATFPRIVAGFPVGAVLGSVLATQLVGWFGRAEDLLLAGAVTQAAFVMLVWITTRQVPGGSGARPAPDDLRRPKEEAGSRPSLRSAFAGRFVQLLLAYQVLSAVGSQLADFLVFDRATALYPDAEDLARFLAVFTAVMNVASIAFLVFVAGPLLRRFGLRLGIPANPLALTVLAFMMIAVFGVAGGASFALLATVAAARIADIALTDGTTRTSINATYQVLPERARLPVQAAVEGIGVPVAIGLSGVLILVLNALPFALSATIVTTVVVCAAWTWIGILLYRAYGPALREALTRRPLLVATAGLDGTPDDEAAARRLLASDDVRSTRLGLDLLASMSSPAIDAELSVLAGSSSPEVRMAALAELAARGDEAARVALSDEVRGGLAAEDVVVRRAALDAVQPGDRFAVGPALAALEEARLIEAAAGALGRLGDDVVPSLAELLDAGGSPAPPVARRLVRAAIIPSPQRDEVLGRHIGHADRELGLAVVERLVAVEPPRGEIADRLDAAFAEDVRHATRVRAAAETIDAAGDARPSDEPLRRALADELDLLRARVRANRLARHGSERIGPVIVEIDLGGRTGALALEALDVLLGSAEAAQILAVVDRAPARLQRSGPANVVDVLHDLVEDADGHWRSAWLRACAIHAARGREALARLNLDAARAIHDPIVDEVLEQAAPPG